MVRRIVDAFLIDAPLKVEALHAALAEEDAAALSMAAHTLKGGCGYVGATRLAELCAALDRQATAQDMTDAASQVAAIEQELEQLQAALEAALKLG